MALRRLDVGQGALAWLFAGSLVMASACSSDSSVDFDPPPSGGGDASSGGTKPSSSGSGTGATQSGGGSNGTAGEDDGGTGNSAGTSATAGKNSGGQAQGGKANGGSGGTTSNGGKAGNASGGSNAGSGGGGKAGNGGSAGASGNAGSGGSAGTAGSGGSAGTGGGGNDCVAATFGGHAYSFCGVVDSAPAAYTKCQSLGMKMVELETLAEHNFVIGKQKGQSWLGGTDELKEGEWRWATTTQVFWDGGPRVDFGGKDGRVEGVYSNFIVGQPNNMNVDGFPENCLAINANGWNDLYCNLGGVRAACEGSGPVIQPTL